MNDIEIFFFNLRDFEWTLKTPKRSKVNDFIPKKKPFKGYPGYFCTICRDAWIWISTKPYSSICFICLWVKYLLEIYIVIYLQKAVEKFTCIYVYNIEGSILYSIEIIFHLFVKTHILNKRYLWSINSIVS